MAWDYERNDIPIGDGDMTYQPSFDSLHRKVAEEKRDMLNNMSPEYQQAIDDLRCMVRQGGDRGSAAQALLDFKNNGADIGDAPEIIRFTDRLRKSQ
jgi:hypothetical protein